jgi:type IV pilus biogenesis protein CpaD/CtpE
MNHPMKSVSSARVSAARRPSRPVALVLACLVVAALASCSHRDDDDDDKKPRKPKRVRDPVEQKVFYDGWWPERW